MRRTRPLFCDVGEDLVAGGLVRVLVIPTYRIVRCEREGHAGKRSRRPRSGTRQQLLVQRRGTVRREDGQALPRNRRKGPKRANVRVGQRVHHRHDDSAVAPGAEARQLRGVVEEVLARVAYSQA